MLNAEATRSGNNAVAVKSHVQSGDTRQTYDEIKTRLVGLLRAHQRSEDALFAACYEADVEYPPGEDRETLFRACVNAAGMHHHIADRFLHYCRTRDAAMPRPRSRASGLSANAAVLVSRRVIRDEDLPRAVEAVREAGAKTSDEVTVALRNLDIETKRADAPKVKADEVARLLRTVVADLAHVRGARTAVQRIEAWARDHRITL